MKISKYSKELVIKLLVLIILLLLILVTSFRSGEKFYVLKNTYFGELSTKVESGLARWKFEVKVVCVENQV